MDIRIEKTQRAIKNAFLELRVKKPLEKISVRELCEAACINKSTFYSHYADIYALSEALEIETVNMIVNSIPHDRDYSAENSDEFVRELCLAFVSHINLINILFPIKEHNNLSARLEVAVKDVIFNKYPACRDDVEINIILSFCIHGAYHTYLNNQNTDPDTLIRVIGDIAKNLRPLYRL